VLLACVRLVEGFIKNGDQGSSISCCDSINTYLTLLTAECGVSPSQGCQMCNINNNNNNKNTHFYTAMGRNFRGICNVPIPLLSIANSHVDRLGLPVFYLLLHQMAALKYKHNAMQSYI